MCYNFLWIFLLVLQATISLPTQNQFDSNISGINPVPTVNASNVSNYDDSSDLQNDQVISVRITSSVAVGRGRGKTTQRPSALTLDYDFKQPIDNFSPGSTQSTVISTTENLIQMSSTDIPANLVGANIEYIKQINSKKESKEHTTESVHPFQYTIKNQQYNDNDPFYEESSDRLDEYNDEMKYIPIARKIPSAADANRFQKHKVDKPLSNFDHSPPTKVNAQNQSTKLSDLLNEPSIIDYEISKNGKNATTSPNIEQHTERRDINKLTADGTNLLHNSYQSDDSIAESSIKSVEFTETEDSIKNIPQTGIVPRPGISQNYIHDLHGSSLNDRRDNSRLTTVNFNIVHDTPNTPSNNNEHIDPYSTQGQVIESPQKFYDTPKIYSQPAQIYSEPAKFYSKPSKVYSEPAKIYSEPAKVYSEPAKVYSEPAKIYSEPAKFYSQPASLFLDQNVPPSVPQNYSPWEQHSVKPTIGTIVNTTPTTVSNSSPVVEYQPEKNYEVDEKVSVLTEGRTHGVQETTTEKCKQDNCKVGYVVEGKQFKKYRVEERTSDGFIVGEYGVVRNEDGALRGVRYTADSDASPRLIHDALMKFLQL